MNRKWPKWLTPMQISCPCFRVSGFGFAVSGFGSRVSGFGSRVSGFGFRVEGSGVRCSIQVFGFRVSGFGFADWGQFNKISFICWPVSGFGCRFQVFGFRVGFRGFWVSDLLGLGEGCRPSPDAPPPRVVDADVDPVVALLQVVRRGPHLA